MKTTNLTVDTVFQSYEESTALISSDVSTTDVATLNTQLHAAFVDAVLDMPPELPLDSNSALKTSSVDSSPQDEGGTDSGVGSGEGGSGCSGESQTSPDDSNKKTDLDTETDPGVYLESGSSGCCTLSSDIKDLVLAELDDGIGRPNEVMHAGLHSNDKTNLQLEDMVGITKTTDTTSIQIDRTVHDATRDNFDGVSFNDMKPAECLSADTRTLDDLSAVITNSLVRRRSGAGDRSAATEEGSAFGCAGEDASFDSSPEPHISSYGGIFTPGI